MSSAQASGTTGSGMTVEEMRRFYLRYIEAANSRDFDSMKELVHDQVTVNGNQVTSDDVIAGFRMHTGAVPDIHWEVRELVIEGDRIAVRAVDTGTPLEEWNGVAPTGAAVTISETAFYRIQDGRFADMWYLMDVDGLRHQLAG